MSIQESINHLEKLEAESKSGSLSEESFRDFRSLFKNAIEQQQHIPQASEIKNKLESQHVDIEDIKTVKEVYSKMQLLAIIKKEAPQLHDEKRTCELLLPLLRDRSSEEKKEKFVRALADNLERLTFGQGEVFLEALSFLPPELTIDQVHELIVSLNLNDRPDIALSLNHLLTRYPELREDVCDRLREYKPIPRTILSTLDSALVPKGHSLLRIIDKVNKETKSLDVIYHYFPKELRSSLITKIKETEKYISEDASEEDVIHSPIAWNYIKELLIDYPYLIQDALYDHWLQDESNIETLFEIIVDNKEDFDLTEENPLLKKAKCILGVLYFFPIKDQKDILPTIREGLKKEEAFSPTMMINEVLNMHPNLVDSVNENIRSNLLEFQDVDTALSWFRSITQIYMLNGKSSFETIVNFLDILEDFEGDLKQSVFDSLKPMLNQSLRYSEILKNLLNENPQLKTSFLSIYENRLTIPENPSLEDVSKITTFAKTILQNGYLLDMDNDHRLMRKAHHILLTLHAIPERSQDLQNPENLQVNALIALHHLQEEDAPPEIYFRGICELRPDMVEDIANSLQKNLRKNGLISVAEAVSVVLEHEDLFPNLISLAIIQFNKVNEYIQKVLEGKDRKSAVWIALAVLSHPILFDPSLQMAVHVGEMNREKSLLKKDNPYTLFSRLQKLENSNPIIRAPVYHTVAGKSVALKYDEMTEFLHYKIDFERLPRFTAQDFTDLVQDSFSRLNSMDTREAQEEVEAYVASITEDSLENLIKNFLESSYLKNLLSDENSIHRAYFVCILKYIADQDNSLEEGSLLSRREEALLKMSASIQHCSGGKGEGISLAYNQLPLEYKLCEVETLYNTQVMSEANRFIKLTISEKINQLFSDDGPFIRQLLRDVDPNVEISNLSHQSLFLKNLIGKKVGLNHSLTFDIHSKLIYPSLIRLSQPEALDAFYQYFTPELIISTLVEAFNRLPDAQKNPIYQGIDFLLQEDRSDVWNLSEGLQITDIGVLKVLLKLGLLQE